MSRKTLRQVSRFVLEEFENSMAPFAHLSHEETEHLLREHIAARQRAMIAVIARGAMSVLREAPSEPTYMDLERLANVRREIREATTKEGAMRRLSNPIRRAAQAWNAENSGRKPSFDPCEMDRIISMVMGKMGLQQPTRMKTISIIDRVRNEWKKAHGKTPSERTVRYRSSNHLQIWAAASAPV